MTRSRLKGRQGRVKHGLWAYADRLLRESELLEERLRSRGEIEAAEHIHWSQIHLEKTVCLLDPHRVKEV